jgi:hypothetical protein
MDIVKEVFEPSELLNFWPTATQSAKERVEATTRFIIYASVLIYFINRDPRIFALGILALAILYYMLTMNMISNGKKMTDGRTSGPLRSDVTLPTLDNSMGNVLLSDYADNPDRPAAAWYPSMRREVQVAWSQIHPFERIRDAERNFYTVPASTIPNDQAAFAYGAFGKPFAPKCHDQGGAACDPDRFYSAFPERPQMEAGNGR